MSQSTPIKIFNKPETNSLQFKPTISSLKEPKSREIDALNWTLPELPTIENRIINKELETKRILINFILFFVVRLLKKISKLLVVKLEISQLFQNDETSKVLGLVYKLILVLFWYNIFHGLYKVSKPNDDFKDLNLTNEQRTLLGLPKVTPQLNTPQLTKIEPTLTSDNKSGASLSPIKKSNTQTDSSTSPFLNKVRGTTSLETPKVNRTPIASPMSSPSPLKRQSPRKQQPIPTLPKATINNSTAFASGGDRLAQPVLKTRTSKLVNDIANTPTYIPSPKYYYRMDSPSKTRRI